MCPLPRALLPLLTLLHLATNPQGPSALADLAALSSHPAGGQPVPPNDAGVKLHLCTLFCALQSTLT